MEPNVLFIAGFFAVYALGAVLLPKILIIPHFIGEFFLALLTRQPIKYHNVADSDYLFDDELFCIMMFAAWPLVIIVECVVYFIKIIGAAIDRFNTYRFTGPKWLTLRGWVSYTNSLLGHKEQK